jgi:hypothetical protein
MPVGCALSHRGTDRPLRAVVGIRRAQPFDASSWVRPFLKPEKAVRSPTASFDAPSSAPPAATCQRHRVALSLGVFHRVALMWWANVAQEVTEMRHNVPTCPLSGFDEAERAADALAERLE